MPPHPQTPAPQDPATNTPPQAPPAPPPAAPASAPAPVHQTGAGHVDFDALLLPKKNAPSVDSAQRINAGVLFEQEQKAALPEAPKPPTLVPAAPPKEDESIVKPLQTYQSDVESLVGEKQVSVVSIAAAEADRRASEAKSSAEGVVAQAPGLFKRTFWPLMIGIILLAIALGVGWYIFDRLQAVPVAPVAQAPFILVDDSQTVTVTPNDGRASIMQMLVAARDGVHQALGLVTRILVAKPLPDGSLAEVSAPEFLQEWVPKVPPQLVRTLMPQMLLGVHSYDQNEPFMILKADVYETAFSAMLAWESTMQNDLLPLFSRTPPVHAQAPLPPAPVASTTASTTPAATTTPAAPVFSQGNFVDRVVDNHDARVILNQDGDILLLWTFLDRNTIVIATNEATLREVISRLSQASIVSLPAGQ